MGVRGEVYQSFEMGSMFSKKKKAAADEEPRTHSAPAALEQWAGGSSPKDGRPSPTANQDRPSTAQETLMATRTGGGAGTQLAAAASAADAPPARPANPSPRTPTHGGANIHNNAASAAPIADSQVAAHHTAKSKMSSGGSSGGIPEGAPVTLWNNLFKEHNINMIFSKVWGERERGLKNIHSLIVSESITRSGAADHTTLWRTVCGILQTLIKDKVAPVYFSSLEVLKVLVHSVCPRVPLEEVHDRLDEIMPALMHRTGNLNVRISQASMELVVFLAGERSVGIQYITPYVLETVRKSKNATSVLAGRLELLQHLLNVFQLQKEGTGGFTVERVLNFAVPALETPDDKVRSIAVALVVKVYVLNGRFMDERVIMQLNPALQKMLHRKFAIANEEAAMTSAIESGDLSVERQDTLPPLSSIGSPSKLTRSALPPIGKRSAGVSSQSPGSQRKKRVLEERALNKGEGGGSFKSNSRDRPTKGDGGFGGGAGLSHSKSLRMADTSEFQGYKGNGARTTSVKMLSSSVDDFDSSYGDNFSMDEEAYMESLLS